jgi:hypothetical protein
MSALEGGRKILWNRHWQHTDGAWDKVRGVAALEVERTKKKKMERVVIQGMANRESRTCDGNLSRTPDPV